MMETKFSGQDLLTVWRLKQGITTAHVQHDHRAYNTHPHSAQWYII